MQNIYALFLTQKHIPHSNLIDEIEHYISHRLHEIGYCAVTEIKWQSLVNMKVTEPGQHESDRAWSTWKWQSLVNMKAET